MRAIVKREVHILFFCVNTPQVRRINFFEPPGSFYKIFHKSTRYKEQEKKQGTRNSIFNLESCALSLVPSFVIFAAYE